MKQKHYRPYTNAIESYESVPIEVFDLLDVFLQSLDVPFGEHLADDHLRQGARVQHRNLNVEQCPVDERLRSGHEPESDAGAQNLGEAVEPDHPAVLVDGEEAGHPLLALLPRWQFNRL